MNDDNRIISHIKLPEGYDIRVAKAFWYGLCFLLDLWVAVMSRISSEAQSQIYPFVFESFLISMLLSAYYFYTFRDRVRWVVMIGLFVAGFFLVEMLVKLS
ncbi:MAG: hypothetical protein HC904_15425 [Blastochloris sp.]|nr:hypothetical protein [Blastochloris sp.]